MAEKEVRKTTTKRVVRRTTTKTAPRKVASRSAASVSARKAPSRIAAAKRSPTSSKIPFVMVIFFLIVLGASAAIGYSDKGQLDVVLAITERKENATPEEQELFKTVPVQKQNTGVPNGGLVGAGKSAIPTPPPVVEQSTTTNPAQVATSTPEEGSDAETPTQDESNEEETVADDTQEAQ